MTRSGMSARASHHDLRTNTLFWDDFDDPTGVGRQGLRQEGRKGSTMTPCDALSR